MKKVEDLMKEEKKKKMKEINRKKRKSLKTFLMQLIKKRSD